MIFSSQKGFNLIEVIIVILVLSLAVGTLLISFSGVVQMSVTPELLDRSVELAERELERVSGLRFSSVVNDGPVSYAGDFSDYSYQIAVSPVPAALAADPGMLQYKQVQVTVTHASAGSVTLSTVVTNT